MNATTKELLEFILRITEKEYYLPEGDIYAPTREVPYPEARMAAWKVITTVIPYTEVNKSDLARHAGRNHASILHGIRKMDGLCQVDKNTKKRIEKLVSEAKNHLFCIYERRIELVSKHHIRYVKS